ncbi:hypothetical protein [Halorubellus sp. PRR65]|uniref:DUF7344 domain-containing protein n=1 Tax=Halorubellus sp. PRR65 TaxID=3098148 RepID=UPI002B26041A|nr:hypothetical protein [Halorubellus sp. PRR65]
MIPMTSDHTTKQSSRVSFDENTRHQLLADERRRTACDVLVGREPDVHLSELADAVSRREASDTGTASAEEVGLTLHHVHLPLLDDADVVDYEASTNCVTPHDAPLDELVD